MPQSPIDETRPITTPLPAIGYRCVCGQEIALDPVTGGSCPACNRRYDPQVLRNAPAETVTVTAGGEFLGALGDPTEDAGDAQIGRLLGHYRLVRRLGHGGMGAVYQALDESLQRYVALKVIRRRVSTTGDSAHTQRLLQEAIAQARVNHPNVIHIYYVGRDEGAPFFAMELVTGPTLEQRLQSGRLPFAEVIHLGLQLVSALQHVHKFDIVHGDIKPSNILMADAYTVKLSDFGLARRMSQEPSEENVITGSPNYLSPEASRGEPTDFRSDMYSLGVTLFEMTFGRLPYCFDTTTVAERLDAHQNRKIEFPETWPKDVPPAWRNVLERLMAKVPADRYPDYPALTHDLRWLQPRSLPKAGRIQRGLAWTVDLAIASFVQQLVFAGGRVGLVLESDVATAFLAISIATMATALFGPLLQLLWTTTVGKTLFQLRIVDRHGLLPGKGTLALRGAVQLLPAWLGLANLTLAFTGVGGLVVAAVLSAVVGLFIVADAGMAMLHPRGWSLHDRLFGTQVVLDTRIG